MGYQICRNCIMDTSDPDIIFDSNGVCNHCHTYKERVEAKILPDAQKKVALAKMVEVIKRDGRGKPYDCLIGVSGGVDSSYVAYLVKTLGLRPLAVHMDNGWNSELAVSNIEKILRKLNIDLHTHVLDWEEFRDLQVAFLRASTPDSEIPTDHAIGAVIFSLAKKYKIKNIISGFNLATEGVLPAAWSFGHGDWKYIYSINKKFGKKKLKTFPHYSLFDQALNKFYYGFKDWTILNLVNYNKEEAMALLQNEFGWRPYASKHYESVYTQFFQGYILPVKFGFDKRRAHLSSLILSGQIDRDVALRKIETPPDSPESIKQMTVFVAKKLGLTSDEFDSIMKLAPKRFWDYPSYTRDSWVFGLVNWVYQNFIKKLRVSKTPKLTFQRA